MKMTKSAKDKIKADIITAKGSRVKVGDLLPVRWKKKLVTSITRKERT